MQLWLLRNFFQLVRTHNIGEVRSKLTDRSSARTILKSNDFLCCQNCKFVYFTSLFCKRRFRQACTKLRNTRVARSVQQIKIPACGVVSCRHWRAKQPRRQQQRRCQKIMIWLVEWGKIIVLHLQHAFMYNCLRYFAKWRREISEFNVLTTTWTHNSYFNSFILYI